MESQVVQQSADVVVVELTAREAAETELELANPLGTPDLDAQFEFMPKPSAEAKAAFFASQWRVTETSAEIIRVERNAATPTSAGPQAQLWLRKRAAVSDKTGNAQVNRAQKLPRAKAPPKPKSGRRVPAQGQPPPPRAA
jgi:hypothetical protein